jgi:tetratricopeptide (TPR) repeat protein
MKKQVFALVVGLLFVPQATMAQSLGGEEADSSKAGVRFQRAVELYREGSYEGALAEFRKAYQTSPTYRVLYNIAQTQYALHDFVGAYKSLMQYMAEGGSDISAERRVQVDEMSAKLVERIAHLQILINVSGADVRVDDVSVGTSPLPGLVPVNVGTRKITAFKDGSPEAVRVVTVAGKESVRIELRLDVPTVASTKIAPSSVSTSAPLIAKSQVPEPPSRVGLIVSISTTGALAIGTGVCGFLALQAQQQLKDQINTYPNTRDSIEAARKKSKNYGYATDALGAATLLSGGAALYFVLTHSWDPPTPKAGKINKSIVLAPTVGGMLLQGSF